MTAPTFKKPLPPPVAMSKKWPELAGVAPTYTSDLCAFYVGDAYAMLAALVTVIDTLRNGKRTHVITDPPYDERTHTGMRTTPNRWKKAVAIDARPGEHELDFVPVDEDQMKTFAVSAAALVRGWSLTFCADSHSHLWRAALEAEGLSWRRRCLWVKTNPMPGLGWGPGQSDETFNAMWNGEGANCVDSWNAGGRGNIWTGPGERSGTIHKTQKPLWLLDSLIEAFTNRGDLVIDPFAGSATTGVSAIKAGRPCILFEKDREMAMKAIDRVSKQREQLTLFGGLTETSSKQQDALPHMPDVKLGRSAKERSPRRL